MPPRGWTKASPQTHCKKGHALVSTNVRVIPKKEGRAYRACKTCLADNTKRWKLNLPNLQGVYETNKRWRDRNQEALTRRARSAYRDSFEKAVSYLGGACTDCGYSMDIRGLEFDHVPEKGTKNCQVGVLFRSSWDVLVLELNKCELVCGTCHNIRTAERRGGGVSSQ